MPTLPPELTRYFAGYEERETAFNSRVDRLIPRRHAGIGPFWSDLQRIVREGLAEPADAALAIITSNPRDSLAFGTAAQVLAATAMGAARAGKRPPGAAEVAGLFNLGGCLDQPLRTLSGGETVRLAMAKAFASADTCNGLTVASPFSWLSRGNRDLMTLLFAHFRSRRLPVEILALEGEDDEEPLTPGKTCRAASPLPFRLALEALRIPLSPLPGLGFGPAGTVRVEDLSVELASPCLLSGANGEGKSLVARVLAGVQPHGGIARIDPPPGGGRVRLLFQDAMTQPLMRTPQDLLAGIGPERSARALDLCRVLLAAAGTDQPPPGWPAAAGGPTLLQLKALLVSIRIVSQPAALILDEPDWGLTRAAALGFTTAAVHEAHAAGVAVLLISHKPWWQSWVASTLAVSRRTLDGGRGEAFAIILAPARAGAA